MVKFRLLEISLVRVAHLLRGTIGRVSHLLVWRVGWNWGRVLSLVVHLRLLLVRHTLIRGVLNGVVLNIDLRLANILVSDDRSSFLATAAYTTNDAEYNRNDDDVNQILKDRGEANV